MMASRPDDGAGRARADHETFEAWRIDHAVAMSAFWQADELHPALRISSSFENVREGIRSGDRRAVAIAVSLLCDDPKLPFGKTIKCRLARALNGKRDLLSRVHQDRIRVLVAKLARLRFPPTEFTYIRKLVRAPGP